MKESLHMCDYTLRVPFHEHTPSGDTFFQLDHSYCELKWKLINSKAKDLGEWVLNFSI